MWAPPVFHLPIMPSIYIAAEIFIAHLVLLWPLKIEEIEAFFNTIAQFTKARSIHSVFYQ
jgi:hypothetical protein